ncbi:UL15A protein [Chelonid alphaherpesvirus 5]|uniref:UL15A protein n=1 Tax=Chelonid alphaherpesvirus 5 TaxID=702736 RepID=V5NWW1_9ALPH|nr:UL15A protein [Chelonid alphaherpesvirus 5]AHA93335.1 UL15A protein [Chelonid alphaherpesvirus 5]
MLGARLAEKARARYERLKRKRDAALDEEAAAGCVASGPKKAGRDSEFLNAAVSCSKRNQTILPLAGTAHAINEAFAPLIAVCRGGLYRRLTETLRADEAPGPIIVPGLRDVLNGLQFVPYRGREARCHADMCRNAVDSFDAFLALDAFRQLENFITRFRVLLLTSFESPSAPGRETRERATRKGRLELFQKMILMHTAYFMANITLSEHSEKADAYLNRVFDIYYFSGAIAKHFKQRTTVFLVPRRHGKTWFLVPLIALLLSCFKDVKIGYTSHIRKATEPVFDEIERRLTRWYGARAVEHVKGERICFSFPDGAKSSIVFASSRNTNVSIFRESIQ